MAETKVVDSWAIIVWLLDQSAASVVESFIQEADAGNLHPVMSWMNVGEVFYIIFLSKRYGPERAADFLDRLPALPIRLVLPDEEAILAAAAIKAAHPFHTVMPSPSHWHNRRKPASLRAMMKSAKVALCRWTGSELKILQGSSRMTDANSSSPKNEQLELRSTARLQL